MDARRERFEAQALPHLDAAYRFALGLTRSRADADDLLQDAMLRAYRAIETLRGDNPRSWLLTIVRHCYFSARASARARAIAPWPEGTDEDPLESLVEPSPNPEATSVQEEQQRAVGRSLSRLSLEHREVLILREIEELSYREIAAVTQLPIGTVMSRLTRARAAFRAQWLADQSEEGA